MVKLVDQDIRCEDRQSSKGNQLKWMCDNNWYKSDYTGYEGLAEYVVSKLLAFSTLQKNEFVEYESVIIEYNQNQMLGCVSQNFLPEGWQLITLERLFKVHYGESLHTSIYKINSQEERVKFMVEQTIRITGLKDFGIYLSKIFCIDALFLNEDRHTHNIAVLVDDLGNYHYCPFFDHGASLLADTTLDYPINRDVIDLIKTVKSKTICQSFDEQLDIIEKMYGIQIRFDFNENDILQILEKELNYDEEIKKRVFDLLLQQKRKYQYLFY